MCNVGSNTLKMPKNFAIGPRITITAGDHLIIICVVLAATPLKMPNFRDRATNPTITTGDPFMKDV